MRYGFSQLLLGSYYLTPHDPANKDFTPLHPPISLLCILPTPLSTMTTTMAMALDRDSFDWAHDAFLALNSKNASPELNASSEKWSTFTRPNMSAQTSIERYGQITPPEDLSPAGTRHDSVVLQTSMPPAQLLGELPWPLEHQFQALQGFQPQQQAQLQQQSPSDRVTKRRRIAKPALASQSQAPHNLEGQTTEATNEANPQPPKRKRGRPKSQPHPQSIEEYSKDGFPFPASNARQSHLEKNRVAAHKCRQRRKEYIDGLEARGREASHKNKALKENVALLREEILELKNEVLRHAGCNFWAVDEYLARCAGDLLGMDGPPLKHRRKSNPIISPASNSNVDHDIKKEREMRADSLPSRDTTDSPEDFDDFFSNLDDGLEGVDS